MEQNDTTTEAPEPRVVAPKELTRPNEGRVLVGVAQGLANRFDIAPWVVRAVFILLAFAGGVGVALYAAGWFLIRTEDETESIAERVFSGATTSRSWIGIGLVFLAALILLDNFTFLSGGVIWAVGLLVVGLLLYTGDLPRLINRAEGQGGSQGPDDKEGVQQMTTTRTVVPETATGDSPAGGFTPPPAQSTPTPPDLPPAKPREKSILGRLTVGVMLLGLGVLALLDNIDGISIDAEPRHYMALAVTILGVGLLAGSVAGRARWLIIVGAILVPTLMFSPAFEYDWNRDEFDLVTRPTTFADLESTYSIDVGRLEIDLTRLPWDGQEVMLNADVDLGELVIRIPDDVGIVGQADLNIGSVSTRDRANAGLGDPRIDFNESGPLGTVMLDAHVDIGNIEIRR
jgi:phage shock protein PspC (stress-responsive transcriptional regulator)